MLGFAIVVGVILMIILLLFGVSLEQSFAIVKSIVVLGFLLFLLTLCSGF